MNRRGFHAMQEARVDALCLRLMQDACVAANP
jgi:hypothetical protein